MHVFLSIKYIQIDTLCGPIKAYNDKTFIANIKAGSKSLIKNKIQ